eukprot:8094450-Alexandrium_andersonii.AAC.1
MATEPHHPTLQTTSHRQDTHGHCIDSVRILKLQQWHPIFTHASLEQEPYHAVHYASVQNRNCNRYTFCSRMQACHCAALAKRLKVQHSHAAS